MIYGLKKYRQFLLARNFVIRTDHAALTYLMKTAEPLGQQARWLDLLAEFDFNIVHRPGITHRNADVLSRLPCVRDGISNCKQCKSQTCSSKTPVDQVTEQYSFNVDESQSENSIICKVVTRSMTAGKNQSNEEKESQVPEVRVDSGTQPSCEISGCVPDLKRENISVEQHNDESIAYIIQLRKQYADQPNWTAVAGKSDVVRAYWAQFDSLVLKNNVLYRYSYTNEGVTKGMQVIVPRSLQQEFIRQAHGGMTGGHFGIKRTQDQVSRRGYWFGWRKDVEQFCKRCSTCAQVFRGKPPRHGLLQPLEANGPMDRLHIDLCGPFVKSNGNVFILMCVDAYTRFLIAVPIPHKTAQIIADKIMTHIVFRFGLFREMLTDLGTEFQNDVVHTLCKLLSIDQLRTTSYRPNCNGKVERANRSLHSLMAKVVSTNQRDWSKLLPACVLAYNMSKNEATSYSPYFLMHGRQALCPMDLLLQTPEDNENVNVNDYADLLVERLRVAYRLVSQHTHIQVERMKKNYNKKVKPQEFLPGMFVWYYYPRRYSERSQKWSRFYTGPFQIQKRINDVNAIIRKTPKSKPLIVHIDKLRPYIGDIPAAWINHDQQFLLPQDKRCEC